MVLLEGQCGTITKSTEIGTRLLVPPHLRQATRPPCVSVFSSIKWTDYRLLPKEHSENPTSCCYSCLVAYSITLFRREAHQSSL